jgi:hypothetical protein
LQPPAGAPSRRRPPRGEGKCARGG